MSYRRRAKAAYTPRLRQAIMFRGFRYEFVRNLQPALKKVAELGKKGWLVDTASIAIPKAEAEEMVKRKDFSDAKYIPVAKFGGEELVFVVHKPTREEIRSQKEHERWEREWKAKEQWAKKEGTERILKISGRNEPQVPVTLPYLLGRDAEGKRYVLDRGNVYKKGHGWDWKDRWEGLKVQVIEKKHRRPSESPGIDEFLESPDYPQFIKDKVKPYQQYDYKKVVIPPWEAYVDKQKAEELVKQSEKTGTLPTQPTQYVSVTRKGRFVLIDWNKPDTVELKKIIKFRGFEKMDEVKFTGVDAPYAVYELEEGSQS